MGGGARRCGAAGDPPLEVERPADVASPRGAAGPRDALALWITPWCSDDTSCRSSGVFCDNLRFLARFLNGNIVSSSGIRYAPATGRQGAVYLNLSGKHIW